MQKKNIELLEDLKKQVENLPHRDNTKLDAIRQRTHMLIDKVFGTNSKYHSSVKTISFRPGMVVSTIGGPVNSGPYDRAWKSGQETYLNLVNTMIEDINLSIEMSNVESKEEHNEDFNSDKIFIVHGHNEEMKQSIARVIEKLDLKPIILHEQANKGRTIIQKFIDHSDVGFAIVLMSADDIGYSKKEDVKDARQRARQNVILELGFFLGKLGVERVIAIFEQAEDFEIPSDYDGVIFIPYDKEGRWKFDIIKELKSLDYNVDANKIL